MTTSSNDVEEILAVISALNTVVSSVEHLKWVKANQITGRAALNSETVRAGLVAMLATTSDLLTKCIPALKSAIEEAMPNTTSSGS